MSRHPIKALTAVSAMQNFHHGQIVKHTDAPGEFFTIDALEGGYRKADGRFFYCVWIRGVEKHAAIPFPARLDDLQPVTLN
jgi:hypothetical protein